jgi:Kef-type K+ transport system membrane component KefB
MPNRESRARSLLLYVLFVGMPIAGIVVALRRASPGMRGAAAAVAKGPSVAVPLPSLLLLLAQLGIILLACRLAGAAMRRIGQPKVVGEMLAGILLGPSLLGLVAPTLYASIFPSMSLGFLSALAQVGLVLFMFLVGLELDLSSLRERAHAAVLTSHASIGVPMLLGVWLASVLFPTFAPLGTPFTAFALFLGAAMSVTAFPVLARILKERQLQGTRLGSMALACAAVDDVSAWLLLAVVVVIARADAQLTSVWVTVIGTLAYVAVMATAGRWLLRRLAANVRSSGGMTADALGGLILLVLASAWTTEKLGIHALFGAFLVGALAPKDVAFVEAIRVRLEDAMIVVLLPIFFAFTGLRMQVGMLQDGELIATTMLVIAVAVAGKLGGSTLAARAAGVPLGESVALGVLMNTRGLMELVILNVGLDIGVISPTIYTMMVVMALTTTAMTTPLLTLVLRRESAAQLATVSAT